MANLNPILWDPNKNKFVALAQSAGGITISAEDIIDNGTKSSNVGGAIFDSTFDKTLYLTQSTNVNFATYSVEGLDYGLYSIEIRAAIDPLRYDPSAIIATLRCSYSDGANTKLLSTTNILGSYFDESRKFAVLGFIINYSRGANAITDNGKMILSLTLNAPTETPVTFYYDYIKITPAMPGVTAIPTILS